MSVYTAYCNMYYNMDQPNCNILQYAFYCIVSPLVLATLRPNRKIHPGNARYMTMQFIFYGNTPRSSCCSGILPLGCTGTCTITSENGALHDDISLNNLYFTRIRSNSFIHICWKFLLAVSVSLTVYQTTKF